MREFVTLRERLRRVAAVFASEWRQLVHSSRTFVFLACMLLALAAGVFLVGGLYDSDFASLDLLWLSLPAVGIALVPALGARAFADEGGNRELELLQTLPVRDVDLVLGKWLAGVAVLAIGLVLTAPIAVTVGYLGTPDWGAAASGALGALLMLATFHAVGIFASAVSRQQTTAYVTAVLMAVALTALGWDLAVQVAPLPAAVLDVLRAASPKFNLDRMATGRIELDAVAAFAVEIVLALAGACAALKVRRHGGLASGDIGRLVGRGAMAMLAAFAVLWLLARVPVQFDATAERLFTLSTATKEIARSVPAGTEIDLYWSETEASVPAHIRDFAHRIGHVLTQLARASNGRLTARVHNVEPDSEAEWKATAEGIRRVPLSSGGGFVLGTVLRSGERRLVTPYIDESRALRLEYDLALALSRAEARRVPKVGLLTSLVTPSEIAQSPSRFAFVDALKAAHDLAVVPFFADTLPDDLDVLVVVGDAPMKRSMLRSIDQHVMRGRGLLVLLDPLTRFNASGKLVSASATSGLDTVADLLARYGVAFDAAVVGDADLGALVSTEAHGRLTFPFWVRATPAQIGRTSPITAGLQDLVFVEAGQLRAGAGAVSLVTTGPRSGVVPASSIVGKSLVEAALALKPDGQVRTLAAMATGGLASPFVEPDGAGASHVARTERASVFVVADVDWIMDQAATRAGEGGARQPSNDNLAFLGNMVEAAAGDHRLLSIRARAAASRRFTRIELMLRAGEAHHRDEAGEAQARIDKVEATVAEILKATKARSVVDLPADVRTRISQLYAETIPARQRLREIRRAMRGDVERLGRWLTALNLAAGPLLALGFYLVVRRRRRQPVAKA